jgi:hypothetical protein
MAVSRSSSKITRKLNLQLVLNIKLFMTPTESESDMLGIVGKLVKDVVHLWRRNFEKVKLSLPIGWPKQQIVPFGVSRKYRVIPLYVV